MNPESGDGGERQSGSALGVPMIPDIDIWRCVTLMINNYGDEAAMEAAACADEHSSKGELEGQRVWLRIARTIDELLTVKPGEARNYTLAFGGVLRINDCLILWV